MGAGADIWNNADEFRYAYKTLDGDGSMVARVVDKGTGSNEWAKGGVMIRQSIAAGSNHAYMPLIATAGNGASFQRRIVADQGSSNFDSPTAIPAPYWVKIDRVGNSFTASVSPDGAEWTAMGDPLTIEMTGPVLHRPGRHVACRRRAADLQVREHQPPRATSPATGRLPISASPRAAMILPRCTWPSWIAPARRPSCPIRAIRTW